MCMLIVPLQEKCEPANGYHDNNKTYAYSFVVVHTIHRHHLSRFILYGN